MCLSEDLRCELSLRTICAVNEACSLFFLFNVDLFLIIFIPDLCCLSELWRSGGRWFRRGLGASETTSSRHGLMFLTSAARLALRLATFEFVQVVAASLLKQPVVGLEHLTKSEALPVRVAPLPALGIFRNTTRVSVYTTVSLLLKLHSWSPETKSAQRRSCRSNKIKTMSKFYGFKTRKT